MSNEIQVLQSELYIGPVEGHLKVGAGSFAQAIPVSLTHTVVVKGASGNTGAKKRIGIGFEDSVGGAP
jgi:hypothetical protein